MLAALESLHGLAVAILDKASLDARRAATAAAISAGALLIYQAALANQSWIGFPDFLIRIGGDEG